MPRGRLAAARNVPASLAMLVRTRLGLSLSNLTRFRGIALPRGRLDRHDLVEAARVAWSVRLAAYLVPFASCLTQAQACQILLAQRGIASTLCLGVRDAGGGRMAAHAWLVCDDRLVLGGRTDQVAAFRLLTELGPVA